MEDHGRGWTTTRESLRSCRRSGENKTWERLRRQYPGLSALAAENPGRSGLPGKASGALHPVRQGWASSEGEAEAREETEERRAESDLVRLYVP